MDNIQLMQLDNGMYQIEVLDASDNIIFVGKESHSIIRAEESILEYLYRGRNVQSNQVSIRFPKYN